MEQIPNCKFEQISIEEIKARENAKLSRNGARLTNTEYKQRAINSEKAFQSQLEHVVG